MGRFAYIEIASLVLLAGLVGVVRASEAYFPGGFVLRIRSKLKGYLIMEIDAMVCSLLLEGLCKARRVYDRGVITKRVLML